jgi:hypothetical protein
MTSEVFAQVINASSPLANPSTQSTPFDILAVGALIISLSTLGFTIWNASRTRKSEQFKIAREMMNSLLEMYKEMQDKMNRSYSRPLKTPENEKDVHYSEVGEQYDQLTKASFMRNMIEEFKLFVQQQGIGKSPMILLYKLRVLDIASSVTVTFMYSLHRYREPEETNQELRDMIKRENEELKKWYEQVQEWCGEGNEDYMERLKKSKKAPDILEFLKGANEKSDDTKID